MPFRLLITNFQPAFDVHHVNSIPIADDLTFIAFLSPEKPYKNKPTDKHIFVLIFLNKI